MNKAPDATANGFSERALQDIRAEFPTLDRRIWLQHAGTSLMSSRVRAAIERAARLLHEVHPECEDFKADSDELHAVLGRLIGADPSEIAITRGTAHGLALCAKGLDWKPGDNVVGAQLEYPTNLLPWMALASKGVELRLAAPDGGRITPERIFELMDDRTRVVALSFVQFWNGFRVDIARIGEECRTRGIVFVVDGAQAVGAMRVDVKASKIDLLASGACKWLMGPVGIGFSYVDPGLLDRIDPPLVGVNSVAEPHPFQVVMTYAAGARRFEESDLSWLDVAGFLAGAKILDEVGIDVIEERVASLTAMLGDALIALGYELAPPWPRARHESSGIVSFRRAGTTLESIFDQLEAAGIVGRIRGDYVRLSPHFYNTEAEIERVIAALS